jgi:RimJ/RimL family protein N-acetyltransferase
MEIMLSKSRLRPWRKGDETSLVRHANNYKVWRNLRDRFPHPYTMADAEWWIGHAGGRLPVTSFAIVVNAEAVGGIGLELNTDVYRRSAEIGYWLGEEYWGQGITTEAVLAVVDYGFATFDICRIFAGVFERNPASMRVLEKAGFKQEARLIKAITKEGQTMDELIYAIVK